MPSENLNKVELKFEQKVYKIELPDLEGFTGQISLNFHCKSGIVMEAGVIKKGSVTVESYQQNEELTSDVDMI